MTFILIHYVKLELCSLFFWQSWNQRPHDHKHQYVWHLQEKDIILFNREAKFSQATVWVNTADVYPHCQGKTLKNPTLSPRKAKLHKMFGIPGKRYYCKESTKLIVLKT